MTDIQADYDEDDDEYEILDKRIMCGQLFQQNAIDKAKGIIAKPMPKSWYDWFSNKGDAIGQKLIADKKPYFMCYVYPHLMARYKKYINNVNKKSLREFALDLARLQSKTDLTEEQEKFLKYYKKKLPVGIHNSVMNKICWKIENEFSTLNFDSNNELFDKNILKFPDIKYSEKVYNNIKNIYMNIY
jgi:capsule polysaccharide export protein KpsE/RkpR